MTIPEAVMFFVGRSDVDAICVGYEFDPAGSDYEYEPDPQALLALSALAGRSVTEKDLWFSCGVRSKYRIPDSLLCEIAAIVIGPTQGKPV